MLPATLAVAYFLLLAQYTAGSASFSRDGHCSCKADENEKWTYREHNGPMSWGENYPTCYEKSQSPIEINSDEAVKDENLANLEMNNYDTPVSSAKIENNGHTIQVTPNDDVERSITVGGSKYLLRQLHFHWGDKYSKGSEHFLDGKQYAMEMHLVHINEDNQIAVVGVFFEQRHKNTEGLQPIVEELCNLLYKGSESKLKSDLNLNNLLPKNPASYYRYSGSLTTPGCAEGVTWTVLTNLQKVGKSQMDEFRNLYSTEKENAEDGCRLVNNYRPIQPLNGRQVHVSQ